MSADKILVLLFSIGGIAFVYWFFLLKRSKTISIEGDSVDIIVEGGYNPETISIPLGKTTKLNFLRKDENSCLEEVVIADFKIKKFLPLNETVTIEIIPKRKGVFPFSCAMNMFHGKIIVN